MQQLLKRIKQAWGQLRNRLWLSKKSGREGAIDIEPIKLRSQSIEFSSELSSSLGRSKNDSKDGGNLENGSPFLYLNGTFINVNVTPMNWLVAFHHCTFTNCVFKPSPNGYQNYLLEFFDCTFIDCRFEYGTFGSLLFKECEFQKSRFVVGVSAHYLRMAGSKGLPTCTGLETVEILEPQRAHHVEADFDNAPLQFGYRHLSWAKLRAFGRLPFFGLSYGGTALILFLLSVIDHYNAQIGRLKVKIDSSDTIGPLQSFVDRLNPLSLNWQMPTLLLGAVLLMIASTIYAWKCPSRIKEFSLERWTKELGKSAVNYVPLTWRNSGWRCFCGICFLAGSFITASVLIMRVVEGFTQALRNL
jgi:hypothetical protein